MNGEVFRTKRSTLAKLVIGFGGLSLLASGCSERNYAGRGNDFSVDARVTDTTWQSITAEVTHVYSRAGEAEDWFDIGDEEEFHDNCDCHKTDGFWKSVERKKYGKLYGREQTVEISPDTLNPGDCVHFDGKIREDDDGKGSHDRPVYDTAYVIDC